MSAYSKEQIDFLKKNGFDYLVKKGENGEEGINANSEDIKKIAQEVPRLIEDIDKLVCRIFV